MSTSHVPLVLGCAPLPSTWDTPKLVPGLSRGSCVSRWGALRDPIFPLRPHGRSRSSPACRGWWNHEGFLCRPKGLVEPQLRPGNRSGEESAEMGRNRSQAAPHPGLNNTHKALSALVWIWGQGRKRGSKQMIYRLWTQETTWPAGLRSRKMMGLCGETICSSPNAHETQKQGAHLQKRETPLWFESNSQTF